MTARKLVVSFLGLLLTYLLLTTSALAQGFNVASTYEIADKDAKDGDIIISAPGKGLTRTNVTYDNRIFGIYVEKPLLVLKEASSSALPIIRIGDVNVNVNDFNGAIKKGDYITTSPILGQGMKAGQSGYVLGIALEDANFSSNPITVEKKQVKSGQTRVAIRIEYAELTTARNNLALLNQLNSAFFRNIQDPEKFTITIRYIIAGLIALIAFAIGFFTVSRSVANAVEAIGRNPLARQTIITSIILNIALTVIGGVITIAIIFFIIKF